MFIYIHTYIHVYTHTYIHTYIYTYIHAYLYTYIHAYIYAYIYTYMHTYINAYMHTYIRTYIHRYTHRCIHTYIHAYTYTCRTHIVGFLSAHPRNGANIVKCTSSFEIAKNTFSDFLVTTFHRNISVASNTYCSVIVLNFGAFLIYGFMG